MEHAPLLALVQELEALLGITPTDLRARAMLRFRLQKALAPFPTGDTDLMKFSGGEFCDDTPTP